jgi:hypothetical protein
MAVYVHVDGLGKGAVDSVEVLVAPTIAHVSQYILACGVVDGVLTL